MIFPKEQGLALRVYYPIDTEMHASSSTTTTTAGDGKEGDIDGILDFTHHFQWSVVFFVLPDLSVLDDARSFVSRAMRLNDVLAVGQRKPPRMLVVRDTDQVMQSCVTMADAISPARCALRTKYTQQCRAAHFCDDAPATGESVQQAAVARRVATAVREWGDRAGFPLGEADILLRVLPSLAQLVTADANALGKIPVEDATKRKFLRFFSANDNDVDDDDFPDAQYEDHMNGVATASAMWSPPSTHQNPSAGMTFPQGAIEAHHEISGHPYYYDGSQYQHYHNSAPPLYAQPPSYSPPPHYRGSYQHGPNLMPQQQHRTPFQQPHHHMAPQHHARVTPWRESPPRPPYHLSPPPMTAPYGRGSQWQQTHASQPGYRQLEQHHNQYASDPSYQPPSGRAPHSAVRHFL